MQIRLDHTEELAKNIKTFWFEPEKPISYIAGQFIEMYLPHPRADERGQKHWFTLSSSPTEKLISITTKHARDQVSTFKQVLFGLKPGSVIKISEPMGDFVLPKDVNIPLVFVAGGIGTTPMRSMVKWLLDSGQRRKIHLIYGVSAPDEVVFLDVFEEYNVKLDIILSKQSAGWQGLTGHITGKRILDIAGQTPEQLIYVSGPEPMTEKLEVELLAEGVPKEKLVLDFFPGYPTI